MCHLHDGNAHEQLLKVVEQAVQLLPGGRVHTDVIGGGVVQLADSPVAVATPQWVQGDIGSLGGSRGD